MSTQDKGFYKRTDEQLATALKKSGGIVSAAGKMLGYADYSGLYHRIHGSALLKQVIEDAREDRKDIAEDELWKQVKKGKIKAITYWLDKQAKDRGYGKDALLAVNITQNNMDFSRFTDEDLIVWEGLINKAQIEVIDV